MSCGNINDLTWVDMGSGNGLLLLGNKPLPEPILTQICVLPDETCQDITLSNVDPDLCHHMVSLGRVTHICVSKLTIIGWDNGLLPDRRQAITWTNDEILLIGPLGANFSKY